MDNGSYYCEAHHLIPISEDGSQGPENVIRRKRIQKNMTQEILSGFGGLHAPI